MMEAAVKSSKLSSVAPFSIVRHDEMEKEVYINRIKLLKGKFR